MKGVIPIASPYQPPASVKRVSEALVQQVAMGLQQPVSLATVPARQLSAPGKLVMISAKKLPTPIRLHESRMGAIEPARGPPRAKKNLKSEKKPATALDLLKETVPILLTLEGGINASHPSKPPVRESRAADLENSTTEIVTEGSRQLQGKGNAIVPRTLANTSSIISTPNGVGRGLGVFNTLLPLRQQPKFDRKEKNPFAVPRKKLVLAMERAQAKSLDLVGESNLIGVELRTSDVAPLPLSHQDTEINWKLIQFPPRVGFRRKIETISRVLALVAHHSSTLISPAGTFLRNTVTLSKVWHYSSILAYYHLSLREFGGRRTSQWIKLKRVDITRADFREWYWYRAQQREMNMRMVKEKWWGERVWREYILANGLQREYGKHGGSENSCLWCSGAININLLNENEAMGQWAIAARFWAGRFCAAMFSGKIEEGDRNMGLILGCGEYAVVDVFPVGENGEVHGNVSAGATVSEVWEVVTKGAGAYIIVGGTGEVIGSLQAVEGIRRRDLRSSGPPEPQTGTTISAGDASKSRQFTNTRGHSVLHKLTNQWDNVSWCSLRLDWRSYVSKLLTYASQPKAQGRREATIALQSETTTTDSVPLLLSHLYHPSPRQFKHAIHENITLLYHRVIAERFILAHAEEYGFSGSAGNPISGGTKIGIDLNSKWRVESVLCSGERMKATEGRVGRLGNGVAFVQTTEGGWYVLEDTGEVGHRKSDILY